MSLLEFIGENPILTVVLVVVVLGGIAEIFESINNKRGE